MTILIVLSSHDKLGETGRLTGTWLEELIVPYYKLIEQGFAIDFASPLGGAAPIDPASIEAYESDPLYSRYRADEALTKALAETMRLADVDPSNYEAVLYPGGHGPLYDLRYDPHSIDLIATTLAAGRPVGTVCHAGCVLIDVPGPDGSALVRGRTLTAFTDSEEAAVALTDTVPYSVESDLRAAGANLRLRPDWEGNVIVDEKLITGQNPASAGGVADALIDVLRGPSRS